MISLIPWSVIHITSLWRDVHAFCPGTDIKLWCITWCCTSNAHLRFVSFTHSVYLFPHPPVTSTRAGCFAEAKKATTVAAWKCSPETSVRAICRIDTRKSVPMAPIKLLSGRNHTFFGMVRDLANRLFVAADTSATKWENLFRVQKTGSCWGTEWQIKSLSKHLHMESNASPIGYKRSWFAKRSQHCRCRRMRATGVSYCDGLGTGGCAIGSNRKWKNTWNNTPNHTHINRRHQRHHNRDLDQLEYGSTGIWIIYKRSNANEIYAINKHTSHTHILYSNIMCTHLAIRSNIRIRTYTSQEHTGCAGSSTPHIVYLFFWLWRATMSSATPPARLATSTLFRSLQFTFDDNRYVNQRSSRLMTTHSVNQFSISQQRLETWMFRFVPISHGTGTTTLLERR